jgi:hypothetical protein
MREHFTEFPHQPWPHVPPTPPEPQRPYLQPTVVVYEKERWEYKVVSKGKADDPRAVEDALNLLGRDGWEIVSVVPLSKAVHFYLKRPLIGAR